MNHLKAEKRVAVIQLLAEGNSIRSTSRITGVHRDTIMRLLVKFGGGCQKLMDALFYRIKLTHLQLDEMWSFVYCKQSQVPGDSSDKTIGDQWIFMAIDAPTKLIPAHLVGKRTAENIEKFLLKVYRCLRESRPPMVSTDGLSAYTEQVPAVLGDTVRYGQLTKMHHLSKDDPKRRTMTAAFRDIIQGPMKKADICTSHIERVNLTTRNFMRRCMRKTLGFSKKLANFNAAVSLNIAWYNFCRTHRSLGMTPAMAHGITKRFWEPAEFDQSVHDFIK